MDETWIHHFDPETKQQSMTWKRASSPTPKKLSLKIESCYGCDSRNRIRTAEHPPYSPDLAPSDFYLFPRLKEHLRGTKFQDNSEVMTAMEAFWESQDNDFFSKGILDLDKRWTKCIDLLGDYV